MEEKFLVEHDFLFLAICHHFCKSQTTSFVVSPVSGCFLFFVNRWNESLNFFLFSPILWNRNCHFCFKFEYFIVVFSVSNFYIGILIYRISECWPHKNENNKENWESNLMETKLRSCKILELILIVIIFQT